MRDMLDTVWLDEVKSSPPNQNAAEISKGLWIDLSQSLNRKPISRLGFHLNRRSVMYSFEHDRCLSALANLRTMGHSSVVHGTMGALRDLSGEGCSLPLVCLLNSIMYANPWGSWWSVAAD
jgi:hypothetical protein